MDWKPISTAPKGRAVQGYGPVVRLMDNGIEANGRWQHFNICRPLDATKAIFLVAQWVGENSTERLPFEPTFWAPVTFAF
jgi:hypothetical protein